MSVTTVQRLDVGDMTPKGPVDRATVGTEQDPPVDRRPGGAAASAIPTSGWSSLLLTNVAPAAAAPTAASLDKFRFATAQHHPQPVAYLIIGVDESDRRGMDTDGASPRFTI